VRNHAFFTRTHDHKLEETLTARVMEAAKEWEEAKGRFEKKLLGG